MSNSLENYDNNMLHHQQNAVPELSLLPELSVEPIEWPEEPDLFEFYHKETDEKSLINQEELFDAVREAYDSNGDYEKTAERTITGIVGTGSLALASTIDNSGEFVEKKSFFSHIKEKAQKHAKHAVVLGVAAAALTAWGFELGPWNESLRANVGFDTFKASQDALKTGGTVFAATLPIEFIPAALVALGLSRKNMPGRGVIEWMHRKLGAGEEEIKVRTKVDIAKDGSLALGVGAAAVVAKRFMTEKDMNLKKGLKSSAALAPVIALFSGGVGWATAFGILHAEGSRFEGAAEFLKNNGTDAKFWLAIFGGLQVMDFASKALKSRKERKQAKNSYNEIAEII